MAGTNTRPQDGLMSTPGPKRACGGRAGRNRCKNARSCAEAPVNKPQIPKEKLNLAIQAARHRYEMASDDIEALGNPDACTNRWIHGQFSEVKPGTLESQIKMAIDAWTLLNYNNYIAVNCLKVWSIKRTCEVEGWFLGRPHGVQFCIQLDIEEPLVVKMFKKEASILVYLTKDVTVGLEELFSFLVQDKSQEISPNAGFLFDFWKENGKKFDWAALPNELKWIVVEKSIEGRIMRPFHYNPRTRRANMMMRQDNLNLVDCEQIPSLYHIFPTSAAESDMMRKTIIRVNTYWFDRVEALARFLRNIGPGERRQLRKLHLKLTHGDFLILWRGGLKMARGRRAETFQDVVRMLQELQLDELYLDFQLSGNMRIQRYFGQPEPFACHAKAVDYICQLAARYMPGTKKIVLAPISSRPSQRKTVQKLLVDVKNHRVGAIPRANDPIHGHVRGSGLWPCDCRTRCYADHFDNADVDDTDADNTDADNTNVDNTD